MNIIICGAGRVGFTIAKILGEQGHSITVIDQSSEDIQKIDDTLDVKAIVGKATYPSILEKANASNFILRGLRDSSDFDNEAQNALMNKTLDNSIETIFLISSKNVREISSTNVRQILSLAGDVSNFMSNEIISYINSLKT